MNGYYPVMLQLRGRRCVIAGGGRVAERKVSGLIEAGADDVTVVSPQLTEQLEHWALSGKIRLERRLYIKSDTANAFLVFAATDNPAVNSQIAEDAKDAGALVGVMDQPEAGSFISPAAVRRGDLLIAVSAAGASPSLAARIKRELEQQYGEEYAAYAERLGRLRKRVMETVEDERRRSAVLRLAAEESHPFVYEHADVDRWLHQLLKLT